MLQFSVYFSGSAFPSRCFIWQNQSSCNKVHASNSERPQVTMLVHSHVKMTVTPQAPQWSVLTFSLKNIPLKEYHEMWRRKKRKKKQKACTILMMLPYLWCWFFLSFLPAVLQSHKTFAPKKNHEMSTTNQTTTKLSNLVSHISLCWPMPPSKRFFNLFNRLSITLINISSKWTKPTECP